MLPPNEKPTSRLKSNLNLKPKGNVARNGNLRIIRHCLAEITTLQNLGYTTQSIRELILTSFKVEISPRAFSSNLYTAKKKVELLQNDVELIASDVLRLTENYKSGNLEEVVERIARKGNIYHSAQRKTKAKIQTVSPVASIQAVEARPAPQTQQVLVSPASVMAKASSAPLASPLAQSDGLITLPSKAPTHIQKMEDDFTQRTGIKQGMKERATLMNYIAQHYVRLFELQQQTMNGENKTWQKELTDFSNAQKR